MLASPAPLTSHWLAGFPGIVFSAAMAFAAATADTTMVSDREAFCPPAVTWALNVKVPATVGVPEMTPVLVVRVSPEGSPLAIAHTYGGVPPLATSVAE